MRAMRNVIYTLALVALVVPPAAADGHDETHKEAKSSIAAATQRNLAFVGGRAVDLAAAIPAESFGWRPMEGVRSVSEAIMHMASANYFFASRFGTAPPEGVDVQGMESITDKEACVDALRASIAHLDAALGSMGDPHAEMDIFGQKGTAEDMLLVAIGHVHEHFGQLIAYARANQIVPPWSR